MRRMLPLLLTALLVGACSSTEALGPRTDAGGAPPITTDSTQYTLRPHGRGLATDIAIRFQNQSNSRMYIVNCHQQLAPVLQKKAGDSWITMWSPVLLMCLSPPIVVRPGEVLERRIAVGGAMPGTNEAPQWASTDVEGTYRIVLSSLVYNYDDGRQGFGEPVPLELRVSNEFRLER